MAVTGSMEMDDPLYGINVAVIAETCQVHLDTARRWKRTRKAPAPALKLLRCLFERDLSDLSPEWAGWVLRRGELVSPQGDRFSPGMVLAGGYYREMARDADRLARIGLTDACGTDPTSFAEESVSLPVCVP